MGKNNLKTKIDTLNEMGFTVIHVPEFDYFDVRLELKNSMIRRTISHPEMLQVSLSKIVKEFTDEIKLGLIHEMIDKTFSEPPNFIQPKAYNRKEEN